MVMQDMRNVSLQIHFSYQTVKGRMGGHLYCYPRDSSASSLPRQLVLFALRLPSHRETWESYCQHGGGGLRAGVVGVCWFQWGRDESLAGEITEGQSHT